MSKKKSSAAFGVIEQMKEMIARGEYKAGSRLPAERQLASFFGVSRATVREAIHYFEAMGIVQIKAGSGSYLAEEQDTIARVYGVKQLIETYNVIQMIEAREILEIGAVTLAARTATREDKMNLRKCYDEMEKMLKKHEGEERGGSICSDRFLKVDLAFHNEIAKISRNAILQDMIYTLQDMLEGALPYLAKERLKMECAFQFHQKILCAISENNEEKAKEEMHLHLKYMREVLEESQNLR